MSKPLYQLLNIKKGLIAITGAGGKSTLMHALAWELPGSVIITTSTSIYPLPGISVFSVREAEVKQAFTMLQLMVINDAVVCVGAPVGNGKLTTPIVSFRDMKLIADYVLVEADASPTQPVKAHDRREPKIPDETNQIIQVFGASGFNRPIREAVDKPEPFSLLTGANPDSGILRPDLAAKAFRNEGLTRTAFINQVETPETYKAALTFKQTFPEANVVAGSLKLGIYTAL